MQHCRSTDRKKEMMRYIYADNAATTKMSETALRVMTECMEEYYGNPSSLHAEGQRAAAKLQEAREQTAACIGAQPREIYFTSGGSEADNQAILTAAQIGRANGKKHLISTAFEHHAVLHSLRRLEKEGFEITLLDPDLDGFVTADQVRQAIRRNTAFVSVMTANNEIGTIQPIAEIGAVCREAGVLFHTDAVQAAGHIPLDVNAMKIDMLSLSGHKFHGPKGIGALYVRQGIPVSSLIEGGAQERGRRAGTENLPAIAAMAAALEEACSHIEENAVYVTALRDYLIDALAAIPQAKLNGSRSNRLPGNVNIMLPGVESETLLMLLDQNGIAASSGSACASGSLDPSHVLLAIGLTPKDARSSIRLSLCETNTREDVERIAQVMPELVNRLRRMAE